jgi:hypothetical protein
MRWGRCGRGETCGTPGMLAMLAPGAQSERPRKRTQSRVVDLDSSLGPGAALAKLARTWDETNIYTKGTASSVK